ncbi:hypothetical protein K443DRAFT_50827, partial [Laccaria amethystina LaAM-08-1]
MQFRILLIQTVVLLFIKASQAAPVDQATQTSCQIGDIWGAANAACSASCIVQQGDFHGGYCDE